MRCLRCGKYNPDNRTTCYACGFVFPGSAVVRKDDTPPQLEALVTKRKYHDTVAKYLKMYPYPEGKTFHNPYSGYPISSKSSWDSYIRMYAFRQICEDVYASRLAENNDIAKKLAYAQHERDALSTQCKQLSNKLARKSKSVVPLIVFFLLALVILFIISASWKNTAYKDGLEAGNDIGYNEGYDDGHEVGYRDGYADGLSDGSSDGYSISSGFYLPTSQTVYVSSTGKIHSNPSCSGMKHYTEMSMDAAIDAGYVKCKKCY